MKDKFIQIVTGQWKAEGQGSINHTLYGLTEEGKVFRFMVNDGWQEMKKRPSRAGKNETNDEDPF